MTTGVTSLLWFVLVLALIPAALWLLKRSPLGGASAQGPVRTVAVLPLGAGQRLVTVEVGSGDDRRWLVLGVTAQSVNTLHSLAPQPETPPAVQAAPFAQLMARLAARKEQPGAQ